MDFFCINTIAFFYLNYKRKPLNIGLQTAIFIYLKELIYETVSCASLAFGYCFYSDSLGEMGGVKRPFRSF